MKQSHCLSGRIYLFISLIWISAIAEAGTPLWTFQPLTATTVTVPVSSTASVQYQVTNLSSKTVNLQMQPLTGITASGCTPVAARQSCTLTLQLNGANLPASVVGGPVLCNQGNPNQCYRPSSNAELHITTSQTPALTPAMIASGTYIDVNTDARPMIAVSQDNGATWGYPSSINAPVFTPDNTNAFDGFDFQGSAGCAERTCISIGAYVDINFVNRPILAVTQDSGAIWTYPSVVNSPVFTPDNTNAFVSNGLPGGVSCNGATCVVANTYNDNNGIRRPMAIVSQDHGATWFFPSSINAPVFTPNNTNVFSGDAAFDGASCSGTTCIMGGQYRDNSSVFRPLIAVSQNNGTTWSYPSSINAPVFTPNNTNAFSSDGRLIGASCSGASCIAAGQYTDNSAVNRPLVAVSQDHGVTWIFPSSINAPVFTPNNANAFADNGIFNDASCSGTTCIAVGIYLDNSVVNRPLLAVSQDSGVTWSYPSSINAPVFTPSNANAFASNGIFYGASCNGTTCIAVGQYMDNGAVFRPLLAVSQDSGVTWSYPSSINAPVFTPDNTNAFASNGRFRAVSCNGTSCIATGGYTDINTIGRPLLAVSLDNGATWSYPSSINAPVFTPDNTNAFQNSGVFEGAGSVAALHKLKACPWQPKSGRK